MKVRTEEFAKKAILLCRELPPTREGRLVGGNSSAQGLLLVQTTVLRAGHDQRPILSRSLASYWKK